MKKWIAVIIFLLVLIGGVSYVKFQEVFPELTVKVMLDKVQEDNYARVLDSDKLTLSEEQRELLETVLSTISYDIKGSRIEGKEAFVTIDLTFVDVLQLVVNERMTILKQVLTDFVTTLDDLLNNRKETLMMRTLLMVLQDESIQKPMMNKTIDLPLKKERGFWLPNITEEWLHETFEIPDDIEILKELEAF